MDIKPPTCEEVCERLAGALTTLKTLEGLAVGMQAQMEYEGACGADCREGVKASSKAIQSIASMEADLIVNSIPAAMLWP